MSNDDDPTTRIIGAPVSAPSTPRPEADSDATVIRVPSSRTDAGVATKIQPAPAARPAAAPSNDNGNMLPVGTFLAEFELTDVLGEGGFGIVYLARDHSLHRRVALKEYMPSSLAARVGGTQVAVKSERHRETFEAGLKSFVNEARLLASFDHPSLVKVYRFWEANGTAYMVMPFYEGITLKEKLKEMGEPPDEAWLRDLLEPLTEALAVIHAEQCFHRDIAPDNVILLKGSNLPLLLDFGAARRVIGDMTQALTVILKPGYAPVEQYAEVPGMKQGAWTDVYALAAVVYYAVTGKTPPTSVGRLMNDSYVPMVEAGAGRYSPAFLAAIDRALAVKPEERTQSISQMRVDLGMDALDPARPAAAPRTRIGAPARGGTAQAGLPGASRSRMPLVVGGAVVAIVALGFGLYAWLGTSKPAAPVATTMVPVPSAAPSPAPVVATAPPALPSVSPSSSTEPVASGPFEPGRDFERIAAGQSPDFHVDATLAKPRMHIGEDHLSFSVKSEKEGYVYVFLHGTDDVILQVYPNQLNKNNRLRAGQSLTIPPPQGEGPGSWNLPAGGPAGTDSLIAIVSANPRDFSAAGMKVSDKFLQTTRALATEAASRDSSGKPLFLGKPVCREPCADDYGARVFTAEEVN
ncbi:MAG TPA: protein kinase [Caldimonas sp.]